MDNGNTTQDCYVCLEPAQTIATTPCNHSDPLCETCFLKIICKAYFQRRIAICPLCRTQWRSEPESESESEHDSEPESEQDSAIDEANYALYNALGTGDERLVRQMLN